jgi:small subunit ribosomal protein S9
VDEQEKDNLTPDAGEAEAAEAPATEAAEAVAVETETPEAAATSEAVAVETEAPEVPAEAEAAPVATEAPETSEAVADQVVTEEPPVEAPAESEVVPAAAEAATSETVEPKPEPVKIEPIGDGPFYGTGRRKTAVARVFLRKGSGQITVNDRKLENFFATEIWQRMAVAPLVTQAQLEQFDASITVSGGGSTGQAGAISMGIARALVKANPNFHGDMRKGGFLTRDARKRERKKYGQKGARRRFQWTKR